MTNSAKIGFFSRHPRGLYVLFFTEMWERFSFYGMRALLVLYMTQYLLFDPEKARAVFGYDGLESVLIQIFGPMNVQQMSSQIYGLYTGFVYLTPVFGGFIADRFLGQNRSVYLGGILMTIGHFLMATESLFLVALVFLIFGNGFFKPNISTQVGNLYPEGDSRRDSAFTLFYMGINLGAFFSPIVCGTLGQTVGWHYGFAAAGVGMILGLLVYHFGRRYVPQDSKAERQAKLKEASNTKMTADEWKRVGVICLLCFLNIVFWGIYEQQGNTLQLWADERTNWNFFGVNIPSTIYQSFNPGFIFIFAPILTIFWAWQFKRKKEPTSTMKMGIGCILCGLGFVIMIVAARALGDEGRGSVMWLTATTWMFTMGELYLSPIGLSFVSKVAPRRIASMMMGVWFLSSFFGNYASGLFGMLYSVMAKESFFAILAAAGVATGLIFVLLNKSIVRAVGKDA